MISHEQVIRKSRSKESLPVEIRAESNKRVELYSQVVAVLCAQEGVDERNAL